MNGALEWDKRLRRNAKYGGSSASVLVTWALTRATSPAARIDHFGVSPWSCNMEFIDEWTTAHDLALIYCGLACVNRDLTAEEVRAIESALAEWVLLSAETTTEEEGKRRRPPSNDHQKSAVDRPADGQGAQRRPVPYDLPTTSPHH